MKVVIAVVLSLLLGSCAPSPNLLERIIDTGELRVVTRNSPTTFYFGAEQAGGVEYELARGFAKQLGVQLRIYTTSEFWQLFPEVSHRSAHVAAAGLAVTAPRQQIVDFGPRYQRVVPQLVYRMGTRRPETLADVAGARLEVIAGTMPVALLEEAREQIPELTWTERTERTSEALVKRVSLGEADYAIVASNEFHLLRHYYPEAKLAFDLAGESNVAWAIPKGETELRERVDAYFTELEASGKLREILNRHDYSAQAFDFVGSRAFMRHLESRLSQYRWLFEEASLNTGVDWRLLAAISYQESHWDAAAVSPTGVRGLMMLTERTAKMMGVSDRADARQSILGGARYFSRVLEKFPARIPAEDRELLAAAAYNIGFGHVEDARIITEIQGGDPDSWDEVAERLPLLADEAWYSRVRRGYAPGIIPVQYVRNVERYRALLKWMAGTEVLSRLSAPRSDVATAAVTEPATAGAESPTLPPGSEEVPEQG